MRCELYTCLRVAKTALEVGHLPSASGSHPVGTYYHTAYTPSAGPVGPYPSCPYHPPYGGYAGWHLPQAHSGPDASNAVWSAHYHQNGNYPDNPTTAASHHPHSSYTQAQYPQFPPQFPSEAHPYAYQVSRDYRTPYPSTPYQPPRNSSSRSLGANGVPDESILRTRGQSATRGPHQMTGQSIDYPRSRNNSSSSIARSSAHNAPYFRPQQTPGEQNLQLQSTLRGYHYPDSRYTSSTSIHRHDMHGGDHSTPYEPSTWENGQRFHEGTALRQGAWGHVSEFHPPGSHSQESSVTETPPETQALPDYQLAPLLSARAMHRPSIDWCIWDKMYAARMKQTDGMLGFFDKEIEVFVGRKDVKEPIYIKSPPGRTDGFSFAISTWGPIRVVPRFDSTIKMFDVMVAIYRWLATPLEERNWMSVVFEKHITQAFEMRKSNANSQAPVSGDARKYAQTVDMLFCRVRWNGLMLSGDFAESKIVYLNLLDVRS